MDKNSQILLTKTDYLKRFCMIYLLKFDKNMNLNNVFLKNFHHNKIFFHRKIELKYTLQDFSKFFFLFQKIIDSLQKKKINYGKKLIINFKKKKTENSSLNRKKNILFIKNFHKNKEKNFSWFYENKYNSFHRKFQKNRNDNFLFNMKTLLKIISNELSKYSILGFSKKAISFVVEILREIMKKTITSIRDNSMKRQLTKKKFADEWGVNNIIEKKNKILNKLKFNFQQNIKNSIRKFKIKKEVLDELVKKARFQKQTIKSKVERDDKEKKNFESNELLVRANKTLMTLLNEILQSRVEELRKATSCLCPYKPAEINQTNEMIANNKGSLNKKKKTRKKKKETNKIKSSTEIPSYLSRPHYYLSGIDCFLFLKKNKFHDYQILSNAILMILMSDFNSRTKT